MRTLLFSIFACATLATAPLQFVAADDDTAAPATGGGQGQRAGALRQMFQQLDLTDAQKAQIKQIRDSTPAGKERRQQIMAVLTPDQKAKLMEMFKNHRGAAGGGTAGGASTATTGIDAPATNPSSSSSANSNTDTDLPPP